MNQDPKKKEDSNVFLLQKKETFCKEEETGGENKGENRNKLLKI